MSRKTPATICVLALSLTPWFPMNGFAQDKELTVQLRSQKPIAEGKQQFHVSTKPESWQGNQTAVIVCDMWDSHHCVNAVRRVAELAPQIDHFVNNLRDRGVTIIHAPSGCMSAYQSHPARVRATEVPLSKSLPPEIANWCDRIPNEESVAYPVDQSAGGEDDEANDHEQWAATLTAQGRNPKAPWLKQCDKIHIDEKRDFLSDSGQEIWSILETKNIPNVILVGVHTNMCVLGRPFGLRRLASNGKHVVLARDLTDTMYDPQAWPYVSHFTGTDLVINHIERYVCPTISSNQILGHNEFRFSQDRRVRLAMLIAEDEYETNETLPAFAARHLGKHFSVTTIHGSETDRSEIPNIEAIEQADALLVSVRRRPLPARDLQRVRDFVASGKPVIGIRTASHAFSLRNAEPAVGLADWKNFDVDVFGGNYTNHYGNNLQATVTFTDIASQHPLSKGLQLNGFTPKGSLYKTAPVAAGCRVLMEGHLKDEAAQPVAWTYVRSDGGRSFYTSLGHVGDFQQPEFAALLSAGIHWACSQPVPTLAEISAEAERYKSGKGKQRK